MRQLSDDVGIEEIEKTFRNSPGLTYKLLLLVNSVAFTSLQKICSVRHAITMLGRSQMKRWVQLALFAADNDDVASNPLLDMAAVRGGLMEELTCNVPALRNVHDAQEQAFMTGILSLLEVLYDIPMQQVANELNLSEEVQLALLERGGIYGTLLTLVQALEQFDFEAADPH
jgi:EAL and modified HD-GYP domain-containing signal transduction protein